MGNYERILIVDGDPQFVEALRFMLLSKSYAVATASSKALAQEIVGSQAVNAVVLGTIAPRGDAFAFHQWLKQGAKTRGVPLMVVDGPPEKQLLSGWRRDEGLQMEAEDYLRKPIEPAMLTLRLEKLLQESVEMIKVLIVDDHTVVREGLSAVLTLQKDMQVVGEAVDGQEAVRKTVELKPDVVLMDIVMPVMSGLEATKHIASTCPQTRVLVLTQFDDKENVASARQVGAWGFIPKRAASAMLLDGIRAVFKGQHFDEALAVCA